MKKRIITAFVGIPILLASILFNNRPFPFFAVIMLLICELSLKEFYDMAKKCGDYNPKYYIGYISVGLMIVASALKIGIVPSIVILGLSIIASLIWMLRDEDFKTGCINLAWTITGIVYLGYLPSHLVLLGNIGNNFIIWTIATVFSIDIFAFIVGCSIGKHKFAPRVSPKKSIEGLVGGFAGTYLVGLILNNVLKLDFEILPLCILLALMYACAVFGDLIESYIKRAAGIKDSSNMLPGHGGFMDRFDSLFMTGFVVYYFAVFFL